MSESTLIPSPQCSVDSYKGSHITFPRSASPSRMHGLEEDLHKNAPRTRDPRRVQCLNRPCTEAQSTNSGDTTPSRTRTGSTGSDMTAVSNNSPEKPTGTGAAPKWVRSSTSNNELLIFVGPIAVFTATLNAGLLSFAYGIFNNNATPTIIIINGTTMGTPGSGNGVGTSAIEQIVLICFYLAMILSLCAGAFAWLMHDDVLEVVWNALGRQHVNTTHLTTAVKSGSLFWAVSFILPSAILTCIGLQALVWSQSQISIGVSISLAMCLCIWQLYRVLRNIGNVVGNESPDEKV